MSPSREGVQPSWGSEPSERSSQDDGSEHRLWPGAELGGRMRRMSAHDTAGWQNFYVMVGGAAAALTGLLFVAMSLHSKAIIATLSTAPAPWAVTALGIEVDGRRAPVRHPDTLRSLMTQLFVAGTVLFGWNVYVAWVLITEVSD